MEQSNSEQSNQMKLDTNPPKGVKVEFEWEAPERLWQPRSRVWFLSIATTSSIIILMAARLGFFILIIGVLALMMLLFIHASIPPLISINKITNKGIVTRDVFLRWENIRHFWFGVKDDNWIMYLDFKDGFEMPRLPIIFNQEDEAKLFELIVDHVKYATTDEAQQNFIGEFLYGRFIPIHRYIKDLDQPESVNLFDEEIAQEETPSSKQEDTRSNQADQ